MQDRRGARTGGTSLSFVVSLDPGLRMAGVAVFSGSTLVLAALARNPIGPPTRGLPAWSAMAAEVSKTVAPVVGSASVTLAAEVMRVYPRARRRARGADPNDLLELNGVVGCCAGLLRPEEAYSYYATDWGGGVPKEVKNSRTLKLLSASELETIRPTPASLRHNVIDAISIGLFHLGRYGKQEGKS